MTEDSENDTATGQINLEGKLEQVTRIKWLICCSWGVHWNWKLWRRIFSFISPFSFQMYISTDSLIQNRKSLARQHPVMLVAGYCYRLLIQLTCRGSWKSSMCHWIIWQPLLYDYFEIWTPVFAKTLLDLIEVRKYLTSGFVYSFLNQICKHTIIYSPPLPPAPQKSNSNPGKVSWAVEFYLPIICRTSTYSR